MGADEFPLGLDLVGADVALVGGDADLFIDAGEATQFLDVAVHRLVGVVRQGLAVLERGVLVFLQDGLGDFVQFDGKAVGRLLGRDFNVVALDIAASEVVDVGVPEAGEAAEEEDVPDRIQIGLGFGELDVLLESRQIDTHRLHLLEGGFRPGVLFSAEFFVVLSDYYSYIYTT